MVSLVRPNVEICIVCSDFQESLRFYHELLGLEIVMDINIDGGFASEVGLAPRGFRQVRMMAGETVIKLMDIEPPPSPRTEEFAAGVRFITFFTANLRATYDDLKRKGVRFLSEPIDAEGWGVVVNAVDPDGVLIEMFEPNQ